MNISDENNQHEKTCEIVCSPNYAVGFSTVEGLKVFSKTGQIVDITEQVFGAKEIPVNAETVTKAIAWMNARGIVSYNVVSLDDLRNLFEDEQKRR